MSRKMGKKLKEPGKTLSEGSPTLAMGFYPPRAFPRSIPFGNGTPGLIGWHPWPILVPGVLRSWENYYFPHHTAPLGFIRVLTSHQTLPGRIPICGKPLFPLDHVAFLPPVWKPFAPCLIYVILVQDLLMRMMAILLPGVVNYNFCCNTLQDLMVSSVVGCDLQPLTLKLKL